MMTIAITLHLLGTVVWVGGMFFAHMALRPVANSLLEPGQRLPLLHGVLSRFFLWVWVAIASLLGSGYWIFISVLHGKAPLYIHLMQGIGLVMVGIFSFIYFGPFRRMGAALRAGELAPAGKQMAVIRRLIGTNLILGLIATLLGGLKLF